MTFYIMTFGCKVNYCESENIHASMQKNGFSPCENFESADVVIVNSCSVTAESDRKIRQAINKVKNTNPKAIIVLTGCMAQAEPDSARKIEAVDIIVGNSDKYNIANIISDYFKNSEKKFKVKPIFEIKTFENMPVNCVQHRSRAFLKIEDGCNRFCSYCIIPYARGKVRSKPLENIAEDVSRLAKNGYKEIVLVGINLSSYGMDLGCDLADAVHCVCVQDGIERVRLSSLEPDLMTDDIINKLAREPKLCPQFHLALQSGSDKILKLMRRRYTTEEYLNVVEKLKAKFKNATFTTDLMVGFPGETEQDFEESLNMIEKVNLLKAHVFPYSIRPGTLAAKFDNQLTRNEKTKRAKKAIETSNENCEKILQNFLGETFDVLYETCDDNGIYEGYTANYIHVKARSDVDIRKKIVPTTLTKVQKSDVWGIIKLG